MAAATTPTAPATRATAATPPAKPQEHDAANLSALRDAAKALAASPPVDAARVAELKAAIAGGDYKPDPDAIAAKMLSLDRGSRG